VACFKVLHWQSLAVMVYVCYVFISVNLCGKVNFGYVQVVGVQARGI
jgi:hypothetical protein